MKQQNLGLLDWNTRRTYSAVLPNAREQLPQRAK